MRFDPRNYMTDIEAARVRTDATPDADVHRVDGALEEETLDLSTFTARQLSGVRYGVTFARRGSGSGGVLALRNGGSGTIYLRPGDIYAGRIEDAELVKDSTSISAGNARLVWARIPGARYEEPQGQSTFATTTAYTAAQSSTANIPSTATDGVDLSAAKGVRAVVAAPAAQTVTAGTGVWWLYDPVLGIWAESPNQQTLVTGRRGAALPDEFTTVGNGRAFLEIRSGTCSGAGSFTVQLYAGG